LASARYRSWFDAIRNKRRVFYIYKGEPREGCPHVLGLAKDGNEKVLVYRILPGSARPEWRCLFVAEAAIAGPAEGPWLEGDSHKQRNSCVVDVYIDINRAAEQRFDWAAAKKPRPRSKQSGKKTAGARKKPGTESSRKKKKPRTR